MLPHCYCICYSITYKINENGEFITESPNSHILSTKSTDCQHRQIKDDFMLLKTACIAIAMLLHKARSYAIQREWLFPVEQKKDRLAPVYVYVVCVNEWLVVILAYKYEFVNIVVEDCNIHCFGPAFCLHTDFFLLTLSVN